MFPAEIYENILYYADGKTLFQAKLVCKQWKDIVDYLEIKYDIWEKCCKNDIPKHILFAMQDKCGFVKSYKQKWKLIFTNYLSWQSVRNKDYQVLAKQSIDYFENNITCAKISGSRIIYGNTAGIICVLNEAYEVEDVIITDIKGTLKDIIFMNEVQLNESTEYNHTHAIVVYEKWFLILKLEPKIEQIEMFQYLVHVSVYNDLIAYVSMDLVVRVAKINFSGSKFDILHQLNFCRIYGHSIIRSLCIYENSVILITDKEVLSFDYLKQSMAKPTQVLHFPYGFVEKYWVFYNDIIFCTSNSYLLFSTIGNKSNVIRKFNCMQSLESPVCDVFFYGNVLILGLWNGKIYIYIVDDWSEFDLDNYDLKINVYGEPICSIDVQELEDEHRLLLTMNDYIAQVFICQ